MKLQESQKTSPQHNSSANAEILRERYISQKKDPKLLMI